MVYYLKEAFEQSKASLFYNTMETFSVYILYSESADKYYVGYTADIESRLRRKRSTNG
jgi:GIY-YIG catalytic domain